MRKLILSRRRRTRRVSPQKDLLFHIVRWPLLVGVYSLVQARLPRAEMTCALSRSSCCLWSSLPSLDYTYLSVKSFGGWNGSLLVRRFSRLDLSPQLMVFPGRGRKGLLRSKLRAAKSYAEWKAAALTLDQYLGFDEWKKVCRWSLAKKISYSPSHRRTKVPSLITSS